MKQLKNLFAVGAAVAATAVSTVTMAAVDAGVSTELATAKTDVGIIGGLVLVVLVAAAAFKYMRRAL